MGQLNDFDLLKNKNFSLLTFVLIGAFSSLQFGSNSSNARVSKTFPLNIWAPISDAFSNKQMFKLESSCFNFIAVVNPEGPPPTITTSYSIDSLVIWHFYLSGLFLYSI